MTHRITVMPVCVLKQLAPVQSRPWTSSVVWSSKVHTRHGLKFQNLRDPKNTIKSYITISHDGIIKGGRITQNLCNIIHISRKHTFRQSSKCPLLTLKDLHQQKKIHRCPRKFFYRDMEKITRYTFLFLLSTLNSVLIIGHDTAIRKGHFFYFQVGILCLTRGA